MPFKLAFDRLDFAQYWNLTLKAHNKKYIVKL